MITHPALLHNHIKVDDLLGLEFIQGEQDCYTMMQRVFKNNLGIILSDYARPTDWWLLEGFDFYRENFSKEGFSVVNIKDDLSNLQPFDCFIAAIPDGRNPSRTVPNHCAIHLEDGRIIHHRYGCRSETREYTGGVRNFTCMTIRHKDVPDLRDLTVSSINIVDLLPTSKRGLINVG